MYLCRVDCAGSAKTPNRSLAAMRADVASRLTDRSGNQNLQEGPSKA